MISDETVFKLGAGAIAVLSVVFVVLLVKWHKDYRRERARLYDKKLPPVSPDPEVARYARMRPRRPVDASATAMRQALGDPVVHRGGEQVAP